VPGPVQWAFMVGLSALLGSFLNVCISRLPRQESVALPRSYCPHCRTTIRWYDNIPLLSFALLGGRCRACRAPISRRYPLVEALAVGIGLLVLWRLGPTWDGARAYVLGLALLAVTFTDFEERIIPDAITLPGIVIGLAFQAYPRPIDILDGVVGCLLGGGLFYAIAWLSPFVFGREGMGGGDIKLAAMLGAFLGWRLCLVGIFVGVLAGGLSASALLVLGRRRWGEYLPFGPFLALGGFVAALWGRPLLAWYLGQMGGGRS
jgi:leader peptidase (prepilin peptidase) / N-methyltransferase